MSCLPFLKALITGILNKGSRTILGYRSDRLPNDQALGQRYAMDTFAGSGNTNSFTTVGRQRSASRSGSEEAILSFSGILKTTHVQVREDDGDLH